MEANLQEDKKFEQLDLSEQKVTNKEFVACEFVNCNFSKANLSNNDFVDCYFKGCNLALVQFSNTGLKNVQFSQCKLMGIDFSKCNTFLFSVGFENSQLDYSVFFQKKMKKTSFKDCSLKEVDFSEVDLSMSVFQNCDLLNASFNRSILEKTDFRTAYNFGIDPELNKMKHAKFSTEGLSGLLSKYQLDID